MSIKRGPSLLLGSISKSSATTPLLYTCLSCRSHSRRQSTSTRANDIPAPTPFVPDVSTFLTLIGRGLAKHSSKFNSWTELFTLSSESLKERGIEPPRTRRYLLRWREKFRNGEYGIGGDFKYVTDGIGELRVVELPSLQKDTTKEGEIGIVSTSRSPGMTKLILNVPKGAATYALEPGQNTKDLKKPLGVTLKEGYKIVGSYINWVKGHDGGLATLKVTEGMWEHKTGRKILGGERRRAETLFKLGVAERRKNER